MYEAKTWLFEIEVEKRNVNPRALDSLGGQINLHFIYSTSILKREHNHSIFFPLSTLGFLDWPDFTQKLLCAALRHNVMLRWCNNVLRIARIMSDYVHGKYAFTPEMLSGQGSLRPCIHINLEVEFPDQPLPPTFVRPTVLDTYDDLIIRGEDLRRLGKCCGGDFGQVLMAVDQDKDVATMKRVRTSGLPEDCGDCSICFESIDKFSVAIQTPCSHMFHESCIGRWFCKKHSCPMCRSACAVSI